MKNNMLSTNIMPEGHDEPLVHSTCFACGQHLAVRFFSGFRQPLATIAWPKSKSEAQGMKQLPIDFVRCVNCGHIYNRSFRYEDVPYSDKPNLMFNQGAGWAGFIAEQLQAMKALLPDNPVVVEIGHGDGSFLSALSDIVGRGTFIGFDPNGAAGKHKGISLKAELFVPSRHMAELKPNLIVTRHVLEHLTHPLAFLQEISYYAGLLKLPTRAYFEVPCVDRVLQTGRTVDFYYEHSSQFTTRSFRAMLGQAGVEIEKVGHGYDGEVIYAFVYMATGIQSFAIAAESARYVQTIESAKKTIAEQLDALLKAKKTIAIWGGTGKSAAFMNHYGLDAARFPLVVDSDKAKAGTFVPGTGQEIQSRDVLLNKRLDVIIIPPQWRAADIMQEMEKHHIEAGQVLIEHDGRLVDFVQNSHPYRAIERK